MHTIVTCTHELENRDEAYYSRLLVAQNEKQNSQLYPRLWSDTFGSDEALARESAELSGSDYEKYLNCIHLEPKPYEQAKELSSGSATLPVMIRRKIRKFRFVHSLSHDALPPVSSQYSITAVVPDSDSGNSDTLDLRDNLHPKPYRKQTLDGMRDLKNIDSVLNDWTSSKRPRKTQKVLPPPVPSSDSDELDMLNDTDSVI